MAVGPSGAGARSRPDLDSRSPVLATRRRASRSARGVVRQSTAAHPPAAVVVRRPEVDGVELVPSRRRRRHKPLDPSAIAGIPPEDWRGVLTEPPRLPCRPSFLPLRTVGLTRAAPSPPSARKRAVRYLGPSPRVSHGLVQEQTESRVRHACRPHVCAAVTLRPGSAARTDVIRGSARTLSTWTTGIRTMKAAGSDPVALSADS